MSRISYEPPIFFENNRFNGTNWITFKNLVTIAAKMT